MDRIFPNILLTFFVVTIAIMIYPLATNWPILLLEITCSVTVFIIVGAFIIIDSEDLKRFKGFFFESIHYIRNTMS